MPNKPLDHESIARAMKEAAWIAKHGTREQRAGWFTPSKKQASAAEEVHSNPKPQQKPSAE